MNRLDGRGPLGAFQRTVDQCNVNVMLSSGREGVIECARFDD